MARGTFEAPSAAAPASLAKVRRESWSVFGGGLGGENRVCGSSLAPCSNCPFSQPLFRSVERVLAPLVELVLKPQTYLVRFHGADRLDDGIDPRLRLELAELARRDGAFAGVMIRESRVPPDAGVQTIWQFHAPLIGPRFLRRP